jgi:hypothetical protein
MDGAMHETVLIILAAVVALIVVVVLLGMRYLRADDEDDFEDQTAGGRGHSRGRGEHPSRDHMRSRHHDDDRQRARVDRDEAMRGPGRDRDRSIAGDFAGAGASPRAASAAMSRGSTSRPGPRRDSSGRDSAGRDGFDRDSGARTAERRVPARDGAGWDDSARYASREPAPIQAARGTRDGAGRGDRAWDDYGQADRDDRATRNGGPPRDRRAPGSRDYDDRDYQDRDNADSLISATASMSRASNGRGDSRPGGRDVPSRANSGPHARPDSRKTNPGLSTRDDSLPEVKPRAGKGTQSKSKRDDDGDWPSTEWDELSDVDYWAELASDKPLPSTPSAPPPSRSARDRGDVRSDPDTGPSRTERRDASERRETADRREPPERRDLPERRKSPDRREQSALPAARAPRQTVDAAFAPLSSSPVDAAFGTRTEAYGSTELRRAIAAGTDPRPTSTGGSGRIPQPLDNDPLTSPSFPRVTADDSRSYRRGRTDTGPVSAPLPPARQQPTYPPAPLHPPVSPLDSQPGRGRNSGGYSVPAASLPAVNSADYAAAPLAPADPYRQPGTQAGDSYLPPANGGYPHDGVAVTYGAPVQPQGYSPSLPVSPGYPGPDSGSYGHPLPGQPMPGQPMQSQPMPSQPGYQESAPYYPAAQRPDQGGYPSQQAAGYSYGQPPDAGFVGHPPVGQSAASYLSYQSGVHTDQAGIYQIPGNQSGGLPPAGGFGPPSLQQVQPGYPTAPYTSAPYEPNGYPTRTPETDGAYPADPYAVDPYGYPGYGTSRLSQRQ